MVGECRDHQFGFFQFHALNTRRVVPHDVEALLAGNGVRADDRMRNLWKAVNLLRGNRIQTLAGGAIESRSAARERSFHRIGESVIDLVGSCEAGISTR